MSVEQWLRPCLKVLMFAENGCAFALQHMGVARVSMEHTIGLWRKGVG